MTTTERTIDILRQLISFDTTSRYSNMELIEWVEAQLQPNGATLRRLPNVAGDKTNLWASIGPDAPGGIVLSGHTDVVPVDGQPWSSDPFILDERGEKLFGRGTSDMKSFLALCIAFAPEFAAVPLSRPVHFAFSYDEEVGCAGSPDMVEAIAAQASRPALCWVGEPTLWGVMSGHKGIATFEVEITGLEAHSSRPHQGASAIHEAADLMTLLREIANRLEAEAPADSAFDPPHATLTIGLVSGGTASNIIARRCEFSFDLRTTPDQSEDEILDPVYAAVNMANARLQKIHPECSARIHRRSSTPPLAVDPESAAELFVRRITGDNSRHVAAYAAEAGQFQVAGIPTVICGPGSIEQAHQPDEWIAISELSRGVDIFHRMIETLRQA